MNDKRCGKCGHVKMLSDFAHNRSRPDGYAAYCKECEKGVRKRHYRRHIGKFAAKREKVRQRLKSIITHEKDKPCADCKTKFPPYVMDFDHLGGKTMAVSQLVNFGSEKRLLAEIAKCEVVCANCHRIRTHSRKAKVAQTGRAPR